jgi:hypothetical protein
MARIERGHSSDHGYLSQLRGSAIAVLSDNTTLHTRCRTAGYQSGISTLYQNPIQKWLLVEYSGETDLTNCHYLIVWRSNAGTTLCNPLRTKSPAGSSVAASSIAIRTLLSTRI